MVQTTDMKHEEVYDQQIYGNNKERYKSKYTC